MRKLFIFISALMLAVTASAVTTEVAPGTNTFKNAVAAASANDVLILSTGTYTETDHVQINKQLTIQAAENATPVIHQNAYRLTVNDEITIIGVTFEAGHSNELLRISATAANKTISIRNCTFRSAGYGVRVRESECQQLENIEIDNCVFNNIESRAIYAEAQTTAAPGITKAISITNSTFVACGKSGSHSPTIEIHDNDDDPTTAGPVTIIDHCTFYNCSPSQYTIYLHKIGPQATISNCIVSNPSGEQATSAYYGYDNFNITNCLWYNCSSGYRTPAASANITNSDPLFTDAANDDFTFPGNWITMSLSPARGAATDASDLGDPRWYTDEVVPSTNLSSAYALTANKAVLAGNIVYETGAPAPQNPYIRYEKSYSTAGTAKWKIDVTKACYISATINMADNEWNKETDATFQNHKHIFGVELFGEENNSIGSVVEGVWTEDGYAGYPTINLPGTIHIEEPGVYTVVLTNTRKNTRCGVDDVTLTYVGGAVQEISTSSNTTLNVADAWFSGCARDNDKTYIQYPSSETSSAWIKWNIATSETKYYDLTVNVNTEYNHGFTAAIYEDEEAEPVASVTEGSYVSTQGVLALELGRVNLVGGKNYIVKVTNAPSGSQAKVTSVVFAPVVATATELPGTLAFSNAVLSEKANITDGMLYFNEPDADKDPRGEWAQWEVTTDHDGLFLFTMGVTSTNGQNYKITIMDNSKNVLDFYETSLDSGDKTIQHYFALEEGSYFIQVENTRSYSKGHLTSLVVTEPDNVVTLDEAATSNESWVGKVVAPEAEGPLYDVQIIRTIKAGMYNTFCLPFEVTSSQCKDIFGSDVQIRTLDEATVETGDFVLNLNFKNASDIYPGTPVLIQTSRDIVNPVFTGVKFTIAAPSATTKTNANFVGTFVKTELEANENLLFLGANNKLYFPTASIDMYGMRAYFLIHGAPAGAIKRARIVENEQIATDIELVNSPDPTAKSQKLMENGQLIIIRDGVRYNAQGQLISK